MSEKCSTWNTVSTVIYVWLCMYNDWKRRGLNEIRVLEEFGHGGVTADVEACTIFHATSWITVCGTGLF